MEQVWNGYTFKQECFEGKTAFIVFPKEKSATGKLAIKTEYWGAFVEAAELSLLENGFHLCYIENNNRWGVDEDLDRKARFIRHLAKEYGLSEKVTAVGMSCGGLIAIKFAAKYPELVDCLYLDAPVLNYLSCPCGFGEAVPLDEGKAIAEILSALKLESVSELIGYRDMPLDKLPKLLQNRIPVVMVAGGKDQVVPYHENGVYLENAYKATDIDFAVYIKPDCDHHPHGLPDNRKVVHFIMSHTEG